MGATGEKVPSPWVYEKLSERLGGCVEPHLLGEKVVTEKTRLVERDVSLL